MRRSTFPVLAVVLGASVALAACGSSSSGKASTSTSSKASTSSSGPGTAVVMTTSNAKFGTILVDSSGKTLYTLTSGGHAVACTGTCLSVWPPLLLPAGVTTATGGSGVTGLGVTATSGGQQVTQGGLPLYRFAGDAAAGDANGNGISSFGGVWHVVKVGASTGGSGGATNSSGSSNTSSTTSGSGTGY